LRLTIKTNARDAAIFSAANIRVLSVFTIETAGWKYKKAQIILRILSGKICLFRHATSAFQSFSQLFFHAY